MWLFTDFGFFSATQSRRDPSKLQIRARLKKDLERLSERLPEHCRKIIETPGRDYPYRIICTREEFAPVLFDAILGIKYGNFKSRVADTQGWDVEGLYSQVWSVMNDAERKLREKKSGFGGSK